MTKEEFRAEYLAKGWEAQPVSEWRLVSSVEGKNKYDVNVVSPENNFGTAQVVEDSTGNVVGAGMWKDTTTNFAEALKDFLVSKEVGNVYAISTTDIKDMEEVAEVKVYTGVGSDVSVADYVVKRRSGTLDFKKIV